MGISDLALPSPCWFSTSDYNEHVKDYPISTELEVKKCSMCEKINSFLNTVEKEKINYDKQYKDIYKRYKKIVKKFKYKDLDIETEVNIRIGEELKIPMWEALTYEQQEKVHMDDRDSACSDYYVCSQTDFKGFLLLNVVVYDPYCGLFSRGSKALYTLNLNTLRPTRNSYIKKELSKSLCKKIKKLYCLE